jgi:hypothetical protein
MTRATRIAAHRAGAKFHQWPAGVEDQIWQECRRLMRQDKLLELRTLQLRRQRLRPLSFRHSGPPKNPALPGSVASAEIPGPRRLTAKFKRLQKTATSYPYCVLAGLVPAKTPGPHPFLVPMGRRAGDCRIATLLAMTDSSQCSTVFFSCQEGGGARHSGPPLAIRNA